MFLSEYLNYHLFYPGSRSKGYQVVTHIPKGSRKNSSSTTFLRFFQKKCTAFKYRRFFASFQCVRISINSLSGQFEKCGSGSKGKKMKWIRPDPDPPPYLQKRQYFPLLEEYISAHISIVSQISFCRRLQIVFCFKVSGINAPPYKQIEKRQKQV